MRGRFCTQPFLVEGGTCRLNDFLLPLRWANRSPPHPTRLRRPTFPPRGRLCAVLPFPSAKPPPPARPAGGRAVTGVGSWAAGQAEKKRGPPQGPPKLEKVGPGMKNLFLPGVLSSGFLPKKAGLPRRSRRGKPTSQVWTCTGSGHPHRRPPLTPPAAGRRPGHAPPVGSPAPPGRAPRPQWCWGARPG